MYLFLHQPAVISKEVSMMKLNMRSLLSGFLLSSMISAAAMGDDLEIYLGVANEQTTFAPNVLFIMDSSGSMAGRDGGTQTRLLRVQNALKETLESATNVNAGLMRFSDFGGPILYPVRSLDDSVDPNVVTSTAASSDDGHEISTLVTLNTDTLKISEGTSQVNTGLRFIDLNIPRGAIITRAFMRFTSEGINTSPTEISIRAEAVGNATTFNTANANISSRPVTANNVDWNDLNDWPVSGELISTPDISAVVQEVVDQEAWCGSNALNILMESTGLTSASSRSITAFDTGNGLAPQIIIEYDPASATGCVTGEQIYQVSSQRNNAEERSDGNQSTGNELSFRASSNSFVGVRFRNLNIPQGASISNAYLEFTAYQSNSESNSSMVITGVNEGDPNRFNPNARFELRNKPKTASVTWSNIEPWVRNNDYRSPPVTSIVQQIVNRGDWEPSNEMMFIMSDFTGRRGAYTYDGRPSDSARLVVEFQGNATPGTTATVRDELKNIVDGLSASGFTPIVDTLYEAASYYGGNAVQYGLKRGEPSVSDTVQRSTRVSHRLSYVGADAVRPSGCSEDDLSDSDCINEFIPDGATYVSPITDLQCQTNNHIVLLSDGEANNNHSVDEIEALLGESCSGSGGEQCGLDLVRNISSFDQSSINTRVTTHTIGFAANSTANNFLNQLSLQSGGGFYTADNSTDLVTAFQTILRSVKDVNATFVSPGVAVNQLNRLTHRDELYFALFRPSEGTIWPGNLKRYRIDGDQVLDRNGNVAVDSSTGFFSENSHSFWSILADGSDVRDGGAASQIDLLRNVYYFNEPGQIVRTDNELREGNSNITSTMLNVNNLSNADTIRSDVLRWARGIDVLDDDGDGDVNDARMAMGDPIHSQPVIVNYTETDSSVFVATNHGFLHSFDSETGEENFAIIPDDLLSNLHDFYQNNNSFAHIYGLDGDMVLRDSGTSKYLYVGMRRGGRNYYVFDITSKTQPRLKFKIEGGTPGFEQLGQSWSRPTLTKVRVGSTERNVMIIGGGYDEEQDSKAQRSADTVGNAVYIIDADTGELIWSASNDNANMILPEMQYSIPARISVVDRENDGFADHMYVVDMGGQMFRLDINNGEGASDLVTGGLMADFAADGTTADNRRFFYGPDVSEISLAQEHYYAVAVGSGYRAHPLDTQIEDFFYMVKDTGVFSIDEDGNYRLPETPLTHTDLYDATPHSLTNTQGTSQQVEANAFAASDGWLIQLDVGGEKVLASPLILDFQVFFTTYVPATLNDSICAPPAGNSRAYLVELINGNAVTDLDQDGQLDPDDRFATLRQTGIAPDTRILIEDIVQPVVCLGTECTSAVVSVDENGNDVACTSDFGCLAQNIYGRFERVQRSAWKSETERQQ
jgi:type IV pilus assembly protein PilY1